MQLKIRTKRNKDAHNFMDCFGIYLDSCSLKGLPHISEDEMPFLTHDY